MNILFVTNNFPPEQGGIAQFGYHICRELSNQGHKVTVIAERYPDSDRFDRSQKFEIHRLYGKIRPTSIETICKTIYFARKKSCDIVFYGAFGSSHWLGGVLLKKLFNLPYVILVHGTELNSYFKRFTLFDNKISPIILRNAEAIIANSHVTKELVSSHGYPLNKIHVVHPGTDPIKLSSSEISDKIKKKFKLEDKKVLLSVSRLVAKKNHVNVLKALPQVIEKIPNLSYLIIGQGEEENKIRMLIKELGLENYVKFLGYIEPSDTVPYFDLCDVFIMPSKTVGVDYESFGIVYLEANACDKPVIAGRSGGIGDAVIDGVTGLMVDPEDIDEIANAVVRLLSDKEYAAKLGSNGRKRVETEMNSKIMGKKVEMILRETV